MTHRLDALAQALPPLPTRLMVGLSGGADSVALTQLLLRRGAAVCAVHVHHGLRGEEADEDERFVRRLCEAWALPLRVFRLTPPDQPGEDWARRARYGCYRQALAQCGADAVALGHHRDDQAETLLLHLLRGSGLKGLCGMPERGEVLGVPVVRPLLNVPRRELRLALKEAGIPWREDGSNASERYLRNAVRHRLLPLMEQLAPGAAEHLAHTAIILRQEESALAGLAQAFLAEHGGRDYLPLAPLAALDDALQARVLRLWWQQLTGDDRDERSLSAAQTGAATALLASTCGAKCNLPGGATLVRGWTHLHLLSEHPPREIPVEVQREAPTTTGDGRRTQRMPRSLLDACEVRTRRTGDWIRPFGMTGRQLLQDYFVNRKVDAPFRDRVPLICRGSEVLLAAGVGAGDIPTAAQDDDVLVRWLGDMPWLR